MTDENATYYYNSVYADELCHKEEVVKIGSFVIPIFFTAVVVLSCIGNILVLVMLALYESLKSLTNVFILNLAVSDLLFTFGLPFWASYYIWGWTFGEVGCKAVKFFFYVGFYSSVLFLTLMTVQRYMAVVHPLSDWERCRGLSVSPFIVWILSGTVALLGSLHSKVMTESESLYCEYDSIEWRSGIAYFQNAFFFIAFLIMGYCYGRMLRTITKSRTNKRHKTVRLIFCIALVFFIGWAPYNIVMFLKSLTVHPFTDCEVSISLEYAYYACRMIAFSHCCLNPVFYVFVGVKFRNHLKMILQKIFQKKKKLNSSQTRLAKNQSQGSMY
ncbi:chemokine (C motif) receptor 1a, duplicate 1 [Sinocyclocheilus rhinocerous]|uniref:chemokine (C motif) receptor 1a, duplicate 1 n=1 Tax=Sinocyclocheilus rhinocerous TaxID=307959 RepID=UPI0007B909CE|nr:PREDICTED: chemokine XC receptor 1-like [Sinocyclocheilus rhinocerous]